MCIKIIIGCMHAALQCCTELLAMKVSKLCACICGSCDDKKITLVK